MNKTDRQYFQQRVENIVKCTNGTIATILNKQKKNTGLTTSRKYKKIGNGKVAVKNESK